MSGTQTMVWILVGAVLVVLRSPTAQHVGSNWIVLMPHAWASSRVSKILASVL